MKIIKVNRFQLEEVVIMIESTILTINTKDYTKEQTKVWSSFDRSKWITQAQQKEYAYVCIDSYDRIVGYCDMDKNGYIDHLFVHHEKQKQGIGYLLLETLLTESRLNKYTTHSSITAVPFFKKIGFEIIEKEIAYVKNTGFVRFFMEKLVK